MFEDQTVFIVGAGASQEFGLPVGWKLLEEIRDNCQIHFRRNAPHTFANQKIYLQIMEKYERDQVGLRSAMSAMVDIYNGVDTAGSIDEFINRYSDDPIIAEVGKLQIAHAIIKAEANSNLIPQSGDEEHGVNWRNAEKTWIAPFARTLFDGIRDNEVNRIGDNITIICFNYDRCIEHYLEYAIQKAYRNVDRQQARKIVRNMKIIHPYGSLGNISQIAYGTPMDHVDLYHVTKNLITWSESVEDDEMVSQIHEAIWHARNIVFMGFAFANQNMGLLSTAVNDDVPYFKNVYSTGFGLTNDVEFKLRKKIAGIYSNDSIAQKYHNRINVMYGMKCTEFFTKHLMNFTE